MYKLIIDLCFPKPDQLARVQQDEVYAARQEHVVKLQKQKEEMDRMLLQSAQKILEQRIVSIEHATL